MIAMKNDAFAIINVNIVNEDLAEVMNLSSTEFTSEVDEFTETGLTSTKADVVASPMLAESPVNLECRLYNVMEFGELPRGSSVVIGEVVQVHIKDDLFKSSVVLVSGATGKVFLINNRFS